MPVFSTPAEDIELQNKFGEREVGITHPDVAGFIRIKDNSDIEIVAAEGLSILMSRSSRSITFVADHIKFLTKHQGGLRWNNVEFNDKATSFAQPTFIAIDHTRDTFNLFNGVDHYMDEHEPPSPITVTDKTGAKVPLDEYIDRYREES